MYNPLKVILLICYWDLGDTESKRVFVDILYRHGARTPLYFYPNDPYINDDIFTALGLGQLTNEGKKQHIKLGKWLREEYSDLLTDPSYIHVRATEDTRVRESATCNLAAMFPEVGSYSIEDSTVSCTTTVGIEVVEKSKDNVLQMEEVCLAYDAELAGTAVKEAWNALKGSSFQAMLRTMYHNAGLSLKLLNLKYVYYLYDTLHIEKEDFHLSLPDWTTDIYPDKLMQATILEFKLPSWNDKLKRLGPGVLLQQMIENMEKKTSGENSLNANIYAAHDITIVSLLNTLGVYDGQHLPDYAACVMMELWKEEEGEYIVKLYYKKSPDEEKEELQLVNCTSPCSVEAFKSSFQTYLPTDWQAECNYRA